LFVDPPLNTGEQQFMFNLFQTGTTKTLAKLAEQKRNFPI